MTEEQRHSRCAAWAREVGLSAAGTAPRTDVFVLVEHPLPWPSNLSEDPILRGLERVATDHAGPDRSVRLQVVAVDRDQMLRKVVILAAAASPFRGYGRVEGLGAVKDLPALVALLLSVEPPPPVSREVTDVLVCTHGEPRHLLRIDGHPALEGAGGDAPSVRIWRTSHTGGHRAPTTITFPDGNYWAHLDGAMVHGLVRRTLDPAIAGHHLRGCAAFAPAVQAADGAVLGSHGWDWLDCARFGDERAPTRVVLCSKRPVVSMAPMTCC